MHTIFKQLKKLSDMTTEKRISANKLPTFPEPFETKEEAIVRAKELKSYGYAVCVLKSKPTQLGKAFYVEPMDTMIMVWETVLYKSE